MTGVHPNMAVSAYAHGWSVRLWTQEFLRWIQRNTIRGFLGAVGVFLLLLLLYFAVQLLLPSRDEALRAAPVVKIRLSELPPPPSLSEELLPPPSSQPVTQTATVRVGIPVPVPDVLVPPEVQSFATLEELKQSPSQVLGGVGGGGNVQIVPDNVQVQAPAEPEPYEFVPVEREPRWT